MYWGQYYYLLSSVQKFSTAATALLMGVGGSVMHTSIPRGKLQVTSPYMLPALVAYRLHVEEREREIVAHY